MRLTGRRRQSQHLGAARPEADLVRRLIPAGGSLELHEMRSRDDFARVHQTVGDRCGYETMITASVRQQDAWSLPGVCQACEAAVPLKGSWDYSTDGAINFRECLWCPHCGLNNRQRFMAYLLQTVLQERYGDTRVYAYEQVTAFFAWASMVLGDRVVGSEYLGHEIPGGSTVEGIRHEDALDLSFADRSLDVIVSNDVFEHVPDVERALAECSRVLREGGHLLFSIPFHIGTDTTVRRAELRGGAVVNLLPPEYHGNPVDPQGSLVFYDYGWDILDLCVHAGFADAYALGYWSALYGYLGEGLQSVFVARRHR